MKRVEITVAGMILVYNMTDEQAGKLVEAQGQQLPDFTVLYQDDDGKVTKKVVINTRQVLALEVTDVPEPITEPTASMETSQAVNKTKAKTA